MAGISKILSPLFPPLRIKLLSCKPFILNLSCRRSILFQRGEYFCFKRDFSPPPPAPRPPPPATRSPCSPVRQWRLVIIWCNYNNPLIQFLTFLSPHVCSFFKKKVSRHFLLNECDNSFDIIFQEKMFFQFSPFSLHAVTHPRNSNVSAFLF